MREISQVRERQSIGAAQQGAASIAALLRFGLKPKGYSWAARGALWRYAEKEKMLVAFGVHIGDIGKRPHPKMDVWIPQLNSAFVDAGSTARIVSWFSKTGNFVIDAPQSDAATVRTLLASVARTPFAILDPAVVRRCVAELQGVADGRLRLAY